MQDNAADGSCSRSKPGTLVLTHFAEDLICPARTAESATIPTTQWHHPAN